MYVKWDERLELGIDFMDSEHKELIEEIDEVLETVDFKVPTDEGIERFYLLECMILIHFDHEELLMRQCEYPAIEEHLESHNRIVDKMNRFKEVFYTRGLDETTLERIQTEVRYVFKNHLLEEDRQLEVFVHSRLATSEV